MSETRDDATASDMGTLIVTMPTLAPDVHPSIDLLDGEDMSLVASFDEGKIDVVPGRYLVTATMPTGERALDIVEIGAGMVKEVELGRRQFEVSLVETPAEDASGPESPVDADADVDFGWVDVAKDASEDAPPPPSQDGSWFLRLLARDRGGRFEPADARADLEFHDSTEPPNLLVSTDDRRVVFAQVAVPTAVPLNVALPIHGATGQRECRLSISIVEDRAQAGVRQLDPRFDAVARYLNTGNVKDAAQIAPDAETLLHDKMVNPFGAALGGYALLRLGRHDLLHGWPRNLASKFDWLPDGAVIAGEEAAQEGDHAAAIDFLCEATARGLPVFADGFSMLVSRVRSYAQASGSTLPDGVTKVHHRHVRAVAKAVLPLTPFMHFARISLAFDGVRLDDPVHSQEAVAPQVGGGWLRYDASAATLREH